MTGHGEQETANGEQRMVICSPFAVFRSLFSP